MKFSKKTSDSYFRITVESDLIDDIPDDEQLPAESVAALILELELLAAELRKLIADEVAAKPN